MILNGLDTLYFYIKIDSFSDELQKVLLSVLDKRETSEALENEFVSFAGDIYNICSGQDRFYSLSIQNDFLHIHFALEQKFNNIPHIKVKVSQLNLWSYSLEDIIQKIKYILKFYNQSYISFPLNRVDFCCHTDLIQFKESFRNRLITRAKIIDFYFEGLNFSGLNIGSREGLYCRIYNKSIEIVKKRKQYFKDIWTYHGWDSKKDVWNIEFELKRTELKELGLEDVNDLLNYDKITSVWKYLTEVYLTLRNVNKKETNKSRWKLNKHWEKIQCWEGVITDSALREKKISFDLEHNKRQILGNIISVIAKTDDSFNGDYNSSIKKVLNDFNPNEVQKKLLKKRLYFMTNTKKEILANEEPISLDKDYLNIL